MSQSECWVRSKFEQERSGGRPKRREASLRVSTDADDVEGTVLTLNVGGYSSQSQHLASQEVQMDMCPPKLASAEESGTNIPVSQIFCIATPNYRPEAEKIPY